MVWLEVEQIKTNPKSDPSLATTLGLISCQQKLKDTKLDCPTNTKATARKYARDMQYVQVVHLAKFRLLCPALMSTVIDFVIWFGLSCCQWIWPLRYYLTEAYSNLIKPVHSNQPTNNRLIWLQSIVWWNTWLYVWQPRNFPEWVLKCYIVTLVFCSLEGIL